MNTPAAKIHAENTGRTAWMIGLGLAALLLMSVDHRGHYLDRTRAAFWTLTLPLYHVWSWPVKRLAALADRFSSRAELAAEVERLRARELELNAEILRTAAVAAENAELRRLLDARRTHDFTAVHGEILSVGLDPAAHRVIIDRGTEDGIRPGQAVLDAGGVFGQIDWATPGDAAVILLSDPDHALPAQVARSGQRTVVQGTGNPRRLVLRDLPVNSDIRIGDQLVTSGLGGRFPTGMPIATISTIERSSGSGFLTVFARPAAALDRSRAILVLRNPAADGTP